MEEDSVIAKYDDEGPRYQYMTGPNGPQMVDLWFKKSDFTVSALYDPKVHNGYHLFTRKNRLTSQPIPLGADDILRASNFDAKKKTVFLIHGWMNTPTSVFNVHLTAAYLNAEDVNVIMVDWSAGAIGSYLVSVVRVPRSARHVAKFINWLIDTTGADINRFHVIGHSLGSHQAGIVGRHLGGRLPYITALDPALPGWITNPNTLTSDVSQYTEVIHTNAGLFGLVRAAGHVDFYPNGGRIMPGCSDSDCNHHRCILYLAESLVYGGFTGSRCDSVKSALYGYCDPNDTLKMGGLTPKTGSSGIFYLTTNAVAPFSRG